MTHHMKLGLDEIRKTDYIAKFEFSEKTAM
jgi:hypothetical protein